MDHFGSVLVLELKQEISDRSLDVGEHGCSIYHTLSEHAEGDFHLESEFDPNTLREQIAPCMVHLFHLVLPVSRFIQKQAKDSEKQLNLPECGKLT